MDPHFPFKAMASRNLDHDHRHALSLLYMPLVGLEAFGVYMTLYSVVDRAKLQSVHYPHAFLYDLLALSHPRFETARQRLEACGLLESYQNETERVYELLLPLTAERFIKDSPFAPYLLTNLGQSRYDDMLALFKLTKTNLTKHQTLTVAFSDVFGPAYENTQRLRSRFVDTKVQTETKIEKPFDESLLLESLPETMIHPSTRTQAVLHRIKTAAYVYGFDEMTCKTLVLKSLNKDTSINFERLTQNALKEVQSLPVQHYAKKAAVFSLDYFKNTDPKTLLEDVSGMTVPAADLKIIEELLNRSTVKMEVLNVLVAYVLRELDQRMPAYNYFDKVLAEWRRNGVEDAEAAIDFVSKKLKQKRESKAPKVTHSRLGGKRLPKDIEVDWFADYLKKLEEES